jgi:hypothetical protein
LDLLGKAIQQGESLLSVEQCGLAMTKYETKYMYVYRKRERVRERDREKENLCHGDEDLRGRKRSKHLLVGKKRALSPSLSEFKNP